MNGWNACLSRLFTLLVYKGMNMEMHRKSIHKKLYVVRKAMLKQEMFIRVVTLLWVFGS